MKWIYRLSIFSLFLGLTACDSLELDLLDNPNAVNPNNANVNFLYNNIQIQFKDFYNSAYFFPASLTRMQQLGGSNYGNSFNGLSFNGIWSMCYSELLPDMATLEGIASEKGFAFHGGTSKIMKAYVLFTMVDLFGKVPYSDALKGTDSQNPTADDGKSIYDAALALLDEGIADLGNANAPKPASDMYYGGSNAKWIALANTLKLRAYNNTRLVNADSKAKITDLVTKDLIDNASEDFVFQYGTQRVNPNTRNGFYNGSYETSDGEYLSTYYMWVLYGEKAIEDPRLRFYFYRQNTDLTDPEVYNVNTRSCNETAYPPHYPPGTPYCVELEKGYWGRDHHENSGTPPDGNLRTINGLYPAGGTFDDNSAANQQKAGTTGALGAGIEPIWLASFTDFVKAEAALTLGTPGDPRALLESGVTKSIDKVYSFASKVAKDLDRVVGKDLQGNPVTARQAFLPDEDDKKAYIAEVLRLYDEAADNRGKLRVIMKEYYIAAWKNGIEVYNNLRRTLFPDNMQPSRNPNAGDFYRTALYPTDYVELNSNAEQKSAKEQVFWDNNPADVIK